MADLRKPTNDRILNGENSHSLGKTPLQGQDELDSRTTCTSYSRDA